MYVSEMGLLRRIVGKIRWEIICNEIVSDICGVTDVIEWTTKGDVYRIVYTLVIIIFVYSRILSRTSECVRTRSSKGSSFEEPISTDSKSVIIESFVSYVCAGFCLTL